MIKVFLAVTIQFNDMEDDNIIVSSFEDVGKYIENYYHEEKIKCILLEPIDYFKSDPGN